MKETITFDYERIPPLNSFDYQAFEFTEDFNQFMPKGYIIELDMNCKSCQDFVETNKKVLVRVSYPKPRLA